MKNALSGQGGLRLPLLLKNFLGLCRGCQLWHLPEDPQHCSPLEVVEPRNLIRLENRLPHWNSQRRRSLQIHG